MSAASATDGDRLIAALFQAADPMRRRKALAALAPDAEGRAGRVCLVGLRGAGKSTLGGLASGLVGAPFVELGGEIEAPAGLPVAEVIALYGPEGYRDLERQALDRAADAHDRMVLAGGGRHCRGAGDLRPADATFPYDLAEGAARRSYASGSRAGYERPMAGHPRAMDELRAILDRRASLYARADVVIETWSKAPEAAAAEVAAAIRSLAPASVSE